MPQSGKIPRFEKFLALKQSIDTANTTVFCQTSFGFPSRQVEPRRGAAVLSEEFCREAAKFLAFSAIETMWRIKKTEEFFGEAAKFLALKQSVDTSNTTVFCQTS